MLTQLRIFVYCYRLFFSHWALKETFVLNKSVELWPSWICLYSLFELKFICPALYFSCSDAFYLLTCTNCSNLLSDRRATSRGCPCPEERESVWPSPRRETRGWPPNRAAAKLAQKQPDPWFSNKLLFTKQSDWSCVLLHWKCAVSCFMS